MGRLIDADSFAENLIHCSGLGRKSFELVLKALNAQPTAYDVEKVMAELKEVTECNVDIYENKEDGESWNDNVISASEAIDIVRKGGVE